MKRIIYPGTFDPITNGHVDLVNRASSLFDEVIVAVAENAGKTPCFPIGKRLQLAQHVLSNFTNVQVLSFNNLLIDFNINKLKQS